MTAIVLLLLSFFQTFLVFHAYRNLRAMREERDQAHRLAKSALQQYYNEMEANMELVEKQRQSK